MAKIVLLTIILFLFTNVFSQGGYIVLKKGHKNIQYFWKDGHFTFLPKDGQWITGIITKISKDSFYFTQEIIRYQFMGADTLHVSGYRFALSDISTLPTKNEEVVYDNDRVRIIPGNEKYVWIRNGFIFRLAGAGYTGLNLFNNLIHKEPPFSDNNLNKLGVGATVFLIGVLLHLTYDPYIRLGKKYHLECVTFSSSKQF
jgi:hypothetical protein